jgi:hypothetical protein
MTTSDIYFLEVRPFGKQYSQRQVSEGSETNSAAVMPCCRFVRKILAATWRHSRPQDFAKMNSSNNLKLVAPSNTSCNNNPNRSERIQRHALTNRDKDIEAPKASQAIEAMFLRGYFFRQETGRNRHPEKLPCNSCCAQRLITQCRSPTKMRRRKPEPSAQEPSHLNWSLINSSQYETQQQPSSNANKKGLDEALQKLKELAQRQQQPFEKRKATGPQTTNSGNRMGSDFQEIEQEAQKLARQ